MSFRKSTSTKEILGWLKIPSEGKHKDYFNVEKLKDWVAKNGTGEKYLKDHKNDPIKPDYQLIRSIDYVEAMLNVN